MAKYKYTVMAADEKDCYSDLLQNRFNNGGLASYSDVYQLIKQNKIFPNSKMKIMLCVRGDTAISKFDLKVRNRREVLTLSYPGVDSTIKKAEALRTALGKGGLEAIAKAEMPKELPKCVKDAYQSFVHWATCC